MARVFFAAEAYGALVKNIQAALQREGYYTSTLDGLYGAGTTQQKAWANRISVGPTRAHVVEPWRKAFSLLGEQEVVQQVQLQHAYKRYFLPALASARRYKLSSELGAALCFDIHVQNGGITAEAAALIRAAQRSNPPRTERALRILIANAVADAARAPFQEDVRSRKLALAQGSGAVHGSVFILENWGLAKDPYVP